MVKRIAAAVLWFYAAATAANVVVLAVDGPSVATAVVGAAAAAFIWLDPFHAIWVGTRSASEGATASDVPIASEAGAQRALRNNI